MPFKYQKKIVADDSKAGLDAPTRFTVISMWGERMRYHLMKM
jgi:hypothetical protein